MRFQRTLIGGGELPALLRPLWCFIAVVSFGQGVGLLPAWAAPAPTITTLSVTSGGNAVTTVAPGSVVTLTATVMAGSTPVTPGQVNFCDATAKFCTDIHLLGTAQLTAKGTATLKFRPGVGSHSYKAVLAEPAGLGPSASTASSLTVTASQGHGATGHNDVPRSRRGAKHLLINGDSAGQRKYFADGHGVVCGCKQRERSAGDGGVDE